MTHGTRYAYRKAGCRCDECKSWNRNRNREQERRNPATKVARNTRYRSRANSELRDAASQHGEPWTESDLGVAARGDLTSRQVAAELGRTLSSAENMRHAVRGAL